MLLSWVGKVWVLRYETHTRAVLKLTRPKKSLHFLFHNPVSNLQFNFNPKYCLQFLNPSLLRSATLHSTKRGLKPLKNFLQGFFCLFGIIWKIRSKMTPLHQSKMTPFARAN